MISSRKAMAASEANAKGLYEPAADEMARMKRVMLRMYRDVARVCRENGLMLLLGGGSALGAVRHGGYIPWDDDLDLIRAPTMRPSSACFRRRWAKRTSFRHPTRPAARFRTRS